MSAEQQRLKKIHREAVILAEAKKVLGFPVPHSALSPVASPVDETSHAASLRTPEGSAAAREIYNTYGLTMTAVNAYLLRYLRSKHLSVDDALAKLRRRRVFERTLPTISVTPTTVTALRSGALHLLGNDLEGRPVLYVNMSAFTLPALELDEAQRLLVILLEFMQAQCLLRNNEDHAEARQKRAAVVASGSPAAPQTVQDVEKETTRHLQQFTLLINEEGAPWGSHESFLRNSSTFFSMFPKYYPLMLGNVLVLGASFEIRMAIKACVGNSPDDVRDAVRMIDRPDLPRYLHAHTIPVELGGQKRVAGSAMNFSEAVLRHWFTLTSQMEEESAFSPSSATSATAAAAPASRREGGGGTESEEDRERGAIYQRPLFVPPPPLGTTQRLISRQRQMIELQHLSGTVTSPAVVVGMSASYAGTSPAVAGGAASMQDAQSRSTASPREERRASNSGIAFGASARQGSGTASNGTGSFCSPLGTRRVRQGSVGARSRGYEATDDGVCSELSVVDDEDDADGHNGAGLLEGSGGTPYSNGAVTTTQMFTAASMSMVSEGELEAFNASTPYNSGHGGAVRAPSGVLASDEAAHYAAHPAAAVAALRRERQLREQAEQALQFRDLGVTLDLRSASTIEKELAGLHQDVNVLVAEVLVKAEAAGKRQKVPPTLTQLLDLTLTAFAAATNTPATVPAMSLAQPCQREPANSSCCSFM